MLKLANFSSRKTIRIVLRASLFALVALFSLPKLTTTIKQQAHAANYSPGALVLHVEAQILPGYGNSLGFPIDTYQQSQAIYGEEFTYNYTIDCDSDGIPEATNVIGNYTCLYANPGEYDIIITGEFSGMKNGGDLMYSPYAQGLLDIKQWGAPVWRSMNFAFAGCNRLTTFSATDAPNLSQVKNMSRAFYNTRNFNGDLSKWDVLNVTNMSGMFSGAGSFNQPLNNWNTSSVTDMAYMFSSTNFFNQPLNNWNMSNVTDMAKMFSHSQSFNQALNNWDTSSVTDMAGMFAGSKSFNQDLSNWNISNVTTFLKLFMKTETVSSMETRPSLRSTTTSCSGLGLAS